MEKELKWLKKARIKQPEIILSADVFDRFLEACEKAKKPNRALREAAAFARKMKISPSEQEK